jgi:peroxiredoxin
LKPWLSVAISLLVASAASRLAAAGDARGEAPTLAGSAPDFQYRANDGRWRALRDLRHEGHVLLVFEPGDEQLAALEREADSLRAEDVLPIAVLKASDAANWSRIERLGLTYSLLSDPRGELEAQFQAAGIPTPGVPAWCLVDRNGRVRGLELAALPASGFAEVAALALKPREPASAVRP